MSSGDKVVNFASVQVEKGTSTSTDTTTHPSTSTSTTGTDFKNTRGNNKTDYRPKPSPPHDPPDNDKYIWVAIGLLIAWLSAITLIGFTQVIDIREKINSNHQSLAQDIHDLETKISDQIGAFERRLITKLDSDKQDISKEIEKQEAEINDLQKMLFNSRNSSDNK